MYTWNAKRKYALDNELFDERISYALFDQIITITNDARENLIGLMAQKSNNVSVIYSGMNEESIGAPVRELRSKYHFDSDEIIILYAGTINKRKGSRELMILC